MDNLFKGAAFFTAQEIKFALDNFTATRKVVSEKVQECKNELKSRVVKRWFRKDTNEYEVAKHDMHVMTFNAWASYFAMIDMMDNDLCIKANRIYYCEYYGTPDDIKNLSSNGTRDCYLNPKQAMFINEWREKE